MSSHLPPELGDRVLSTWPVPVADAVNALLAAESAHERRDRVVEVFRSTVRLLGAIVLATRVQYGAGPGGEPPEVNTMLRSLRRRGLTDGQWVGIIREVLRAWADEPDGHPLPDLVRAMHTKKSPLRKALDGLLTMRKAETVAHGSTGELEDIEELLGRRMPQLGVLFEQLDPLWQECWPVVPLAPPGDGEAQAAWRLCGLTPPRGRWRRIALAPGETLPPGEPILVRADGRPLVALSPIALFLRPAPDAIEELFVLDGGKGKRAVYLAIPSNDVHHRVDVWDRLEGSLLDADEEVPADVAALGRPYRGLDSFKAEHGVLFFGREAEAEALANRIRRHPLVTVTGPSGSGKSSLVQAGASTRLSEFTVLTMRPGDRPVFALGRTLDTLTGGRLPLEQWVGGDLDEAVSALDVLLRDTATRVLIVIDQAEEMLTLCADGERRERFGDAIAALSTLDSPRVRVAIVVREDFFGRLATVRGLSGRYSRQVEVLTTPDAEALAQILVGPAAAFGYTFEDEALVWDMVRSVEAEPAALALLQFCADRLWDSRDRAWKRLTWEAYRSIGEVEGALAIHADRFYDERPHGQKDLIRQIMLRLVTADGTRSVVPQAELLALSNQAEGVVTALVHDARLLTARDGSDGEPVVELVHEALVRHWGRLRDWVNADRSGQVVLQSLRAAAAEWHGRGHPGDLLWRGEILAELTRWRARSTTPLTAIEAGFVRASERREQTRRRARRWGIYTVVSASVWVAVVMTALWRSADVSLADAALRSQLAEAEFREVAGSTHAAAVIYAAAQRSSGHHVGLIEAGLRRLSTGPAVHRVLIASGPVRRLSFPDADTVQVETETGRAHRWSVVTGVAVAPVEVPPPALVTAAAPEETPSDAEAAPTVVHHVEQLVRTGTPLADRTTEAEAAGCQVVPSPTGGTVALACEDGVVIEHADGDSVRLDVELTGAAAMAFDDSGARFAVGERSGRVRMWNVDVLRGERTALALVGGVAALAVSPSTRQFVAAAGHDGDLWVAGDTLELPVLLIPRGQDVDSLRFAEDYSLRAVSGAGEAWWIESWAPPAWLPEHHDPTPYNWPPPRISTDGKHAAAVSQGQLLLIDHAGKPVASAPLDATPTRLQVGAHGGWAAAYGPNGATVIAPGVQDAVRLPVVDGTVHSVAIADELAAAMTEDGTLVVWKLGEPERVARADLASAQPLLLTLDAEKPSVEVVTSQGDAQFIRIKVEDDKITGLKKPRVQRVGDEPRALQADVDGASMLVADHAGLVRLMDNGVARTRLPRRATSEDLLAMSPRGDAIGHGMAGDAGRVTVWHTPSVSGDHVPEATFADAVLAGTNLRLCEGTTSMRTVIPFPTADQLWAPEALCGGAFESDDGLVLTPTISGGIDEGL